MPESWKFHLSPRGHAIETTSLAKAAIITAIGAGTAFALLVALLIILVVMGRVAMIMQRRQDERGARQERAELVEGRLRRSRATAAVVAVGVLMSGREFAERGND